jgi:hypothetical protein
MIFYALRFQIFLIAVKIVLFLGAIIFRPKVLKQYSYKQRINIALNPLRIGRETIRVEDREALRWHRTVWLSIEAVVLLRFTISMSVWAIGTYKPELLCSGCLE